MPSGASENLRKASSATNIVDDLSSIFGGGTAVSEVYPPYSVPTHFIFMSVNLVTL